ncbi:hypothetical protein L2747_15070 [Shewanella marinintestina]|uniref:hypothetical protein n=1 Tax=Shewanella marinintestina TaxID=190305 RepID=UPI00200CFBEC|nr:hypothetical protein [Shewanella marinintestina]MCL1147325.1 hypothetical protein [Shewanella marinintestina]
MENAQKYLSLYNKLAEDRLQRFAETYPYIRSWDELQQLYSVELELEDTVKLLANRDDLPKAIARCLQDTQPVELFGCYQAFKTQDCQMLNDVIFQSTRQRLLSSAITAGGTDHSSFYHNIMAGFACNDFEIIQSFAPADLPFCKYPYYNAPALNLVTSLYYQDQAKQAEALALAEKFLKKKLPILDAAVINFLVALMQGDSKRASEELQQASLGFARSRMYGALDKCFALELHGLYNFARCVEPELFVQISLPSGAVFSKAFAEWQRDNAYAMGKINYQYPPERELMNLILMAKLPKVTLVEHKKNSFMQDESAFLNKLIDAITPIGKAMEIQ